MEKMYAKLFPDSDSTSIMHRYCHQRLIAKAIATMKLPLFPGISISLARIARKASICWRKPVFAGGFHCGL